MSTYILMKILESAPERYDRGIRMLTMGKVDRAYDRLSCHIKKGQRVLDIGCGTGALTLRAARRDASIRGIDINPQMLEIAQRRTEELHLTQSIELVEMGIAELGAEESESYDTVMSALCFSELTEDELTYTLREIQRILRTGGLLLVADEVEPQNILKRTLYRITRIPLIIITYLITQTTTRAIRFLPERVRSVGLTIESIRLSGLDNFIELIARKP
jgi:ubiquinone/menaquinone biosynthesis C-methylase UbiE